MRLIRSLYKTARALIGPGSAQKEDSVFRFFDPGELVDDDLALSLSETFPGDPEGNFVPVYKFKMVTPDRKTEMGRIDLRVGHTDRIRLYVGHIGYRVFPRYRGNRYAARACRLLMPLARRHGLQTLWITCDPDNVASRRTCELAGAELVEMVDLPAYADMYKRGERQKCRYRLDL